jgi:hypothetical protein
VPFFPSVASLAIGVLGAIAVVGVVVWRKKRQG